MPERLFTGPLLVCDQHGSVLLSQQGDTRAYDAFGACTLEPGRMGYNGIIQESMPSGYLLGNGHRLYSPALRRFWSPDHLSPFGAGGINSYTYCHADPVNHVDPSGRVGLWRRLKRALFSKSNVRDLKAGRAVARDSLSQPEGRGVIFVIAAPQAESFNTVQRKAVLEFKHVAQNLGNSDAWQGYRSQLQAHDALMGGRQAGTLDRRLSFMDHSYGVAKTQYEEMFPSYHYQDGFPNDSLRGSYADHATFHTRVLMHAKGQLEARGVWIRLPMSS